MAARKPGEPLHSYISRFVSSKQDEKDAPESKQRLASGYKEAREGARRRKGTSK